jgi:hypothetical protein
VVLFRLQSSCCVLLFLVLLLNFSCTLLFHIVFCTLCLHIPCLLFLLSLVSLPTYTRFICIFSFSFLLWFFTEFSFVVAFRAGVRGTESR